MQEKTPLPSSSAKNKTNPAPLIGFVFILIGIIAWFFKGSGLGAVGGGVIAFLFFLIGIIFWIIGMVSEKKSKK